jgi:tellurite resistance protein TerC
MIWLWTGFLAFVMVMLALDLGIFHRHAHEVSMKEAVVWTAVWVGLAAAFAVFVYFLYEFRPWGLIAPTGPRGAAPPGGREAAVLFLSGYVVEESLSIDNVFVIALLFTYFGVERRYQHRVLFWGIVGALILRAGMIVGGLGLVHRFEWVLYVFGAFLLFTAGKMLVSGEEKTDPGKSIFVRLARRVLPVTRESHGARFLVRQDGRRMLTPLALVLVAVEGADAVFAVDSIPAIFAITDIDFLVFTSNILAVLGLRSMYFALSAVLRRFRYLNVSLIVLLALIGAKMLLKDVLESVPGLDYITLGVILATLGAGVAASVICRPKEDKERASKP